MKRKLMTLALSSLLFTATQPSFAYHKDYKFEVLNTFSSHNELSIGPMFLRATGDPDYAVMVHPFDFSVPAPILSPSWDPVAINAEHHPGFILNFRHYFGNSGFDADLYWARLRSKDTASITAIPAIQFVGPFWSVGPDEGVVTAATGQMNNHYDVFNAEIGKTFNFGTVFKTRLFSGVSGLWLEHRLAANFSGTDPILGPFTFGITTDSKYHAGGLRLGMDGEYGLTPYFSVVGLVAGNLFIGDQQPNTSTHGTGSILAAGGIAVNHQSISHSSYVQVLPGLDAKLGGKFTYNGFGNYVFSLEAGYMGSVYLNAIQNYVPSTFVPGSLGIVSGSVYLQSLMKSTDHFAVDGPYLLFSMQL